MNTVILYNMVGLSSIVLAKIADRKDKENKLLVCIIILLFSLLAGFRSYNVGLDTKNYVLVFSSIYEEHATFEKGFIFLIRILSKWTSDYTLLLCFFSIVTNLLIIMRYWQLRDTVSFHWSIICYYVLFYFNTMSGIRQCLAVAIVFFFSRYVIETWKPRCFFIGILLAMLFHRTALVGILLMIPRLFKEANIHHIKMSQLLIFLITPIVTLIGVLLVQDRYAMFINQSTNFNIGIMAFIRLVLVTLVSYQLYISKRLYMSEKIKRYQLGTYLFSEYMVLFAVFISYILPDVWRIAWYFWPFSPALYSFYLSKKAYGTTINIVIRIEIILILVITWIGIMNGYESKLVPYEFFWQVR